MCLCAGSACTPPLPAGVCGVGVCAWARVLAASRHSWLGRWGVCVLVFALRLYSPLLAGVCGVGVCVWARVSAAPRRSWLGWWGVCVPVCVLPLYPATPGWGVRCGCGFLGSGFGCAPPLLAGMCGVGVCVWAGVSAAPRHSWLGCWGVRVCVRAPLVPRHSWLGCVAWVCVFGFGFPLRTATHGWVLGCVCACVSAPLVPRHSWLECAVWGCVFGLGFRLRPATPGLGVRRGCVCLGSGFSCAPPLLAGVVGCVCAGVRAPLVPRHSWLGCGVWVWVFGLGFRLCPATPGWAVGVCVFVCPLLLFPATPGGGVRRGCVCLGSGFGCAPPLLAGMLRCVSAGVDAPLVPRHSWLGCAVWVCVFGIGFRLRPAGPGWGVGLCVCWCGRSPCTPPGLAGVCGVGVCALVRVSASPATPGWGVGVCVLVCVPPLYPATPGWGVRRGCVCLGSGFGCAPPLLAGVLGCVCAGVRAPLAPRHSWLGCTVWVCVFGLGFRLRPATPGWGVGVCVCLCAGSACTPPLLAGVCGVGVCAWARVLAAPRHSWLGVGLCVCWCSRFACTSPLLAGVCGVGVCVWARVLSAPRHSWLGWCGVCVVVCVLPLYPATPGCSVRCGCGRLGSGFGCALPLLAGMLGCLCAGVRAPLVPCHSWLGCAVWVCVFGLGFPLSPATPV